MQDAEKLQLAVKQMQQILDKAHKIVLDPNLPNFLAASVARDCILRRSQDGADCKFISNSSWIIRLRSTSALRYKMLIAILSSRSTLYFFRTLHA